MKVGKLNWDDLNFIINNNKGMKRKEVRIRTGIGEDCSVIDFGQYECVISTDPITGAEKNIGKLAVNINCNDIASCGVEPLGLLVTIMAPPTSTLKEIKDIMSEIHEECLKLNVEIVGGHTEITEAVNKILISCTIFGKTKSGKAISTAGAKVGDDIVVTKSLAMEGSSILAYDQEERLKKVLTKEEMDEAKSFMRYMSVVKEGVLCGKENVNSMHDITEGGLLGAVWELAKASNVGFVINKEDIPLKEVTKKICEEFKIDPLKLISSGSMLITCKDGKGIVEVLEKEGINATIIGKIQKNKGIILSGGRSFEVEPPEVDELFNIK